jgi:hypothetical protein
MIHLNLPTGEVVNCYPDTVEAVTPGKSGKSFIVIGRIKIEVLEKAALLQNRILESLANTAENDPMVDPVPEGDEIGNEPPDLTEEPPESLSGIPEETETEPLDPRLGPEVPEK